MAKKTEKEVQSTEMEEVIETTEMEVDNVPEPVSFSKKTIEEVARLRGKKVEEII